MVCRKKSQYWEKKVVLCRKSRNIGKKLWFVEKSCDLSKKVVICSNIATFFLQTTTFFPILQLFSTNNNFFLQYCDFFLQTTTFFYDIATFPKTLCGFIHNVSHIKLEIFIITHTYYLNYKHEAFRN